VSAPHAGLTLVLDTATHASIVALCDAAPLATSRRDAHHRHGSHVLEQVDEVLADAGRTPDDLGFIAVGTGPGSFTGLRVGLATAKTIAYARSIPLVGVASSDALRQAAVERADAAPDTVVVQPAGARDHYLARAGEAAELVAPGDLVDEMAGHPALTVDMDPGLLGTEAARLGEVALAGLPGALLTLAAERFATLGADDIAELVPAYVALPRGVARAAEDMGWSPDLR
jgi:tRNA threonylcarbamoyl adenosine modification protein YeaZ